jgi:hypothetical protein
LKLIGTHQLLVYADNVNTLVGIEHTVKKSTKTFLVASLQSDLEVNSDKTVYMIMPRDQNEGRSHHIKKDNISFERVEEF